MHILSYSTEPMFAEMYHGWNRVAVKQWDSGTRMCMRAVLVDMETAEPLHEASRGGGSGGGSSDGAVLVEFHNVREPSARRVPEIAHWGASEHAELARAARSYAQIMTTQWPTFVVEHGLRERSTSGSSALREVYGDVFVYYKGAMQSLNRVRSALAICMSRRRRRRRR